MKSILKLLLLTVAFTAFSAHALTSFYYKSYNADGSPNTNYSTMQAWPPAQNGFTVYGTNIIYGALVITNVPDTSGFFSNACFPNTYRVFYPTLGAQFFVNIPDVTNYNSLAIYATNSPVVSGGIGGFALVTNLLGYVPAPSNSPAIIAAIGFQPATNAATIKNSQLSTNVILTLGSPAASFLTNNGFVWLTYQTNGLMGPSYTNLPPGSFATTTNGQFFVLSNAVWVLK